MSTSFLRTTMRAASSSLGMFLPETPTRLFAGSDAFSVVMIGRLLDITPGALEAFIAREGPITLGVFPLPDTTLGWNFSFDPSDPEVFLTITLADGSQVFGESRLFTAADVGKVHRMVGVCSVADSDVRCYTNGRLDTGIVGAATSYLPAPAPDTYGVLGVHLAGSPTHGIRSWEVCDIAVLDRALTAGEVLDLDELIRSTGRLPTVEQWIEHYRAERLVNHKFVIDAGGRSAGRGWPTADEGPVLGSVLIEPGVWGGSGT